MQWKPYVPGWAKRNDAALPVLVTGGLPLSHTSGWFAKLPLKVRASPVLIVGVGGLYE